MIFDFKKKKKKSKTFEGFAKEYGKLKTAHRQSYIKYFFSEMRQNLNKKAKQNVEDNSKFANLA